MKKKTTKPKSRAKAREVTYTHRDGSGMLWRFEGSRPVSALADKVMREAGF